MNKLLAKSSKMLKQLEASKNVKYSVKVANVAIG